MQASARGTHPRRKEIRWWTSVIWIWRVKVWLLQNPKEINYKNCSRWANKTLEVASRLWILTMKRTSWTTRTDSSSLSVATSMQMIFPMSLIMIQIATPSQENLSAPFSLWASTAHETYACSKTIQVRQENRIQHQSQAKWVSIWAHQRKINRYSYQSRKWVRHQVSHLLDSQAL